MLAAATNTLTSNNEKCTFHTLLLLPLVLPLQYYSPPEGISSVTFTLVLEIPYHQEQSHPIHNEFCLNL